MIIFWTDQKNQPYLHFFWNYIINHHKTPVQKGLVAIVFLSNIEFTNQFIVSAIKFWESLSKFMIPIAHWRSLTVKSLLRALKSAYCSRSNKLRNVNLVRGRTVNVTIQKWKIYHIKINVIALTIKFRRNKLFEISLSQLLIARYYHLSQSEMKVPTFFSIKLLHFDSWYLKVWIAWNYEYLKVDFQSQTKSYVCVYYCLSQSVNYQSYRM